MGRLLAPAAALLCAVSPQPASAMAASACPYGPQAAAREAVILLYHRFGEDDVPSTNIRLEQFAQHLRLLEEGGYHVLDLETMLTAWLAGCGLPEKAVAITVDDAYRSFATHGWPMLKRAGFPVTLFVSTDAADAGGARMLRWPEIRALVKEGVRIGHHSAAHGHMIALAPARARADILRANKRFKAELGVTPKLFAYPYGEYDAALMQLVKELGFTAALAQFSSVVGPGEAPFAVPRFALNEHYGTPARLKEVLSAHALPVMDAGPHDPVVEGAANPPALKVRLSARVPGMSGLTCYASHEGAIPVRIDEDALGFRARPRTPMPPGRQRINCTLPYPGGGWYWFGRFFYVPGAPPD